MFVSSPSHPAMTKHSGLVNSAHSRRSIGIATLLPPIPPKPPDPPDPPDRSRQHIYSLHLLMCYSRWTISALFPTSHPPPSPPLHNSPLDSLSPSPSSPPPPSIQTTWSFSATAPILALASPQVKSYYGGVITGAVPIDKAPPSHSLTTFPHRLLPSVLSSDLNGTRSGRSDSPRRLLLPSPGSVALRGWTRDSVSHRQARRMMSPPSFPSPWSQIESAGPSYYPLAGQDPCSSKDVEVDRNLSLRSSPPTEIFPEQSLEIGELPAVAILPPPPQYPASYAAPPTLSPSLTLANPEIGDPPTVAIPPFFPLDTIVALLGQVGQMGLGHKKKCMGLLKPSNRGWKKAQFDYSMQIRYSTISTASRVNLGMLLQSSLKSMSSKSSLERPIRLHCVSVHQSSRLISSYIYEKVKVFWILKSCNLFPVEEFNFTVFHLFKNGCIFFPLVESGRIPELYVGTFKVTM